MNRTAPGPTLGAGRIVKFILGYRRKAELTAADYRLVTINGTPGLLLHHPLAGTGT